MFATIFRPRPSILLSIFLNLAVALGSAAHAQKNVASNQQQQDSRPPCMVFQQIQLTEIQITGLLASAAEIKSIKENSEDGFVNPRPEAVAELDAVAKKNGLSSYDEFKTVRDNIILIISGYDRGTGKYVGREAEIRLRVARVQQDRTLSSKDKKLDIASLNSQRFCTMPAVSHSKNIALFKKYVDRLWSSELDR